MEEIKALTKVIASLHPGFLRVIVGYGYSHIQGGVSKDISIKNIPQDLRMPNSEFVLIWNRKTYEIIGVERINFLLIDLTKKQEGCLVKDIPSKNN